MKKLVCCLAIVLTACATQNPLAEFEAETRIDKAAMEAGQMAKSVYYTRRFERIMRWPPIPGKAEHMQSASDMIIASRDLESGKINVEQFEDARRRANLRLAEAAQKFHAEEADRKRAAWADWQRADAARQAEYQRSQSELQRSMILRPTQTTTCTSSPLGNTVQTVCR